MTITDTQLDTFHASPQQRRLWSAAARGPAWCAVRLEGAVDPERLARAVARLAAEREILRTELVLPPGLTEPLQAVSPDPRLRLERRPARDLAAAVGQIEATGEALDKAADPRAVLFDLADGSDAVLGLALPPRLTDAGGLEALVAALAAGYDEADDPEAAAAPDADDEEAPLQYPDVAAWLLDLLEGEFAEAGEAFWSERAAGARSHLELPGRRSGGEAGWLHRRPRTLDPAVGRRLDAGAERLGVTPASLVLAAWSLVLERSGAGRAPVVGVTFAGRSDEELALSLGPLQRTIPLAFDPALDGSDSPSAEGFVRSVDRLLAEASRWQEIYLWRDQTPADGAAGPAHPSFAFAFEPPYGVHQGGGVTFRTVDRWAPGERSELALAVIPTPDGLCLEPRHDPARYDGAVAERLAERVVVALTGLLDALDGTLETTSPASPASPITWLPVLGQAERAQLLAAGAGPELPPDGPETLDGLFAAQARRTPEAVALETDGGPGGEEISYAVLAGRVAAAAARLRAAGVGRGDRVALLARRGPEAIVGLLATVSAGAAFVPLDADHPDDRLDDLLARSGARALVGTADLVEPWARDDRPAVALDADGAGDADLPTAPVAEPDDLAYVLHTSGSTGRPKGVMVSHRAIANRLWWMARRFPLGADDRVLHKTPLTFDASLWEVFCPLMAGARVVLAAPDAHLDPAGLVEAARRCRATVIQMVPSMLRFFVAAGGAEVESLERVFAGGEALPAELAAAFDGPGRPGRPRLVNLYGPTETAIDATYRDLADGVPDGTAGEVVVPIGRPLDNLTTRVVDARLRLVPPGAEGELVVGGPSLARGYLGRPAATALCFVPDPFVTPSDDRPGARLYRTGDLARLGDDGDLRYLGRIDRQVKLRGVRVELAEIEAVLAEHPAVAEAAVRVVDDRLIAWAGVGAEGVGERELLDHLSARLPEVMVPARVVLAERLPKTTSGKLDRDALSVPEPAADEVLADPHGPRGDAPRTPVEELLTGVWGELLELDRPGIHDDFFALGGHSLLAMGLANRVRELTGVRLAVRTVFESPTPAALAPTIEAELGGAAGTAPPPIEPVPRDGGPLEPSFAQQRLFFLDQLDPGSAAYVLPAVFRVEGRLDLAALERALSEIVRRHEALRARLLLEDGRPVQRIRDPYPVRVAVADLTGVEPARRSVETQRRIDAELTRPFDLASGELLRLLLIDAPPGDGEDGGERTLVLALHHVAGDGWSSGVLAAELAALYGAYVAGRESPLPELPIQYPDFAAWQRRFLSGDTLDAEVAYWRRRLAGAPPLVDLPSDRPRGAGPGGVETGDTGGAGEIVRFGRSLGARATAFARAEGASLFMTLLAGFSALLHGATGQDDMVLGTDVANRARTDTEKLIGFFVNLLPLRVRLDGAPSFRQLVARVRETALEAYGHQDLPFDKLVEELRPPRHPGAMPLVQVLFVLQNVPGDTLELPAVRLRPMDAPTLGAKFDVALFVWETDDGLVTFWNYKTSLFDRATILGLAESLERLLDQALDRPDVPIDQLDAHSDAERKRRPMEKTDRRRAKLDKLMKSSARPAAAEPLELVRMEPLEEGRLLPLVARPAAAGLDAVEWARDHRELVEKRLFEHGAILFRGFDLDSIERFEAFAAALSPDLFSEYGDLPTADEGEKVYESTPYPADKSILFHNESSHMHRWPLKQFFYCVIPAQEGGTTPLVDCREAYRRLDPEVIERFRDQGLLYVRTFSPGVDVSWQQFFKTDDRQAVERFCERAGIDTTWHDGDRLSIRQKALAVTEHPRTGVPIFFNQLQLHHVSCLDPETRESMARLFGEDQMPRNVLYGDGTPIPDELMDEIGRLYDDIEVTFDWRAGDVVMVDNMLVAHARRPFVGPRRIAVAMGELVHRSEVAHGS